LACRLIAPAAEVRAAAHATCACPAASAGSPIGFWDRTQPSPIAANVSGTVIALDAAPAKPAAVPTPPATPSAAPKAAPTKAVPPTSAATAPATATPATTPTPSPAPTPLPAPPTAATAGFAVQLSAPAAESDANALRDRARAAGLSSFVQRIDTASGVRSGEHFAYQAAVPRAKHQLGFGHRWSRCIADNGNEFVNVGQRDGQAFQHMTAFAGLAQGEYRAARHYFATMRDKDLNQVLQVAKFGLTID